MIRIIVAIACSLSSTFLWSFQEKQESSASFAYDVARTHEIKWYRHTVPLEGIRRGVNELKLTLTVSPTGDVVGAAAKGDPRILKFWPQVEGEVRQWKFSPFEKNGEPVTATVEEFIDLVARAEPPRDAAGVPIVLSNSKITITLTRSMCYGECPAYSVIVSTDGIVFNGQALVVAFGKHTDRVEGNAVRKLAEIFTDTGFYSLRSNYAVKRTDSPTNTLSIAIDGNVKQVRDYVGLQAGMPEIVKELELEVDSFARTWRWVMGDEGLVQALQAENFEFSSFPAQVILKEAATRGLTSIVRELLKAGVPLQPLPTPKHDPYEAFPFEYSGWLDAASLHTETLQVLIAEGASAHDQNDKDKALASAVRSRNVPGVRALIAYGANPNADLSKFTVEAGIGFTRHFEQGTAGAIFDAAESDDPGMVREILRYHPKLEMRDSEGRTPLFLAAASTRASVECVRLLAQAGADVNARDNQGNTPLHKTSFPDVVEELLKLGADVNARNKNGNTPIFTTNNMACVPVLIAHGADLTIRNNQGETVMDFATKEGPYRQDAIRKAVEKLNQH